MCTVHTFKLMEQHPGPPQTTNNNKKKKNTEKVNHRNVNGRKQSVRKDGHESPDAINKPPVDLGQLTGPLELQLTGPFELQRLLEELYPSEPNAS